MDKKLYKSIYKNDIKLTQLILDVTSPTLPMRFQTDELIHEIESLTRGLCFALHHDGGGYWSFKFLNYTELRFLNSEIGEEFS